MKKNTKILSLMLSALLLLGFLPMYADASDTVIGEQTQEESIETVEISSSSSIQEEPLTQSNSNSKEILRASGTTIEDGVYAISAYSILYRWISVENDSPWSGNHLQQQYSTSYPTETFDRSSLFKISQVGTTGRYIIRSMLNNNLSFGISGTEIITKNIHSNDSLVSASDTFYIESSGSGYYIRPYGSSYVINMSSTSTGNLNTVLKSNASSSAKWTFLKYGGVDRSGTSLYWPSSWSSTGIVLGNTGEATLIGWSTYINANTLFMDLSYGYEEMGIISWNESTGVMTLTIKFPGRIFFDALVVYPTGLDVYSANYSCMAVPPEETYYVQNASSIKFMDVEGPSTSSGAIIQQWELHTNSQQKWNVEHVSGSGGYVRLKSVLSNLYLGIDSSNLSLIKQYSNQNDYTLWKIDRTSSGNVRLICKASESLNYTLSVPSTNGNGTDLTQVVYSDDSSYTDEWNIFSTSGTEVYLLSIPDKNHDHISSLAASMHYINLLGYSTFHCHVGTALKDTVKATMQNARVFVTRCHGEADSNGTRIKLYNVGYHVLQSSDIYNFSTNTPVIDLSNCDLMLFIACYTGAHETQSLPHAAVAAGADAAIGFEESIDCEIANDWTEYFFVHYTSPDSSGASAYYASRLCNYAGGIDSYIVIKQP